jgi:Sec-independent protein translocase protein TatA
MSLFGVGAMEAGLVLVIALVLVGPQRFPEIAREGGKWYRIARRFTAEVTKDLRVAVDEIESEIKAEAEDLQSVRELGSLDADLKAAGSDVQAATESIAEVAEEPANTATTTTASAPPEAQQPSTPAEPDEAASASDAVDTTADQQTLDPFKALEARQAAERSRGNTRNGGSETSS